MVTVEQRIAKIRAMRRKIWLSDERFECVCGMKFRYQNNYTKHIKDCWDYKLEDGK